MDSTCVGSKNEPITVEIDHGHSHDSHFKLTRVRALILMMTLNVTFFFVELIIRNITKSNSLVAD